MSVGRVWLHKMDQYSCRFNNLHDLHGAIKCTVGGHVIRRHNNVYKLLGRFASLIRGIRIEEEPRGRLGLGEDDRRVPDLWVEGLF